MNPEEPGRYTHGHVDSVLRSHRWRTAENSAAYLLPTLVPGTTILDVGCGGGLVSEPLARLGARVTGIDPTIDSIGVARRHAEGQGLAIDYRTAPVEELQATGETFDAVVCMEVIEHVPDPAAFVRSLGALVRPGGALIMSTLNRTWKS